MVKKMPKWVGWAGSLVIYVDSLSPLPYFQKKKSASSYKLAGRPTHASTPIQTANSQLHAKLACQSSFPPLSALGGFSPRVAVVAAKVSALTIPRHGVLARGAFAAFPAAAPGVHGFWGGVLMHFWWWEVRLEGFGRLWCLMNGLLEVRYWGVVGWWLEKGRGRGSWGSWGTL